MVEIRATFTLACDRCKIGFPRVAEITSDASSLAEHSDEALAASIALAASVIALRDLAQDAGWLYVLPVGQLESSDLCPACFQMPPEG